MKKFYLLFLCQVFLSARSNEKHDVMNLPYIEANNFVALSAQQSPDILESFLEGAVEDRNLTDVIFLLNR